MAALRYKPRHQVEKQMLNFEDARSCLDHVRDTKDGLTALCPAHNDTNPSLSVQNQDGRAVFKCHAGCTSEQVESAVLSRLGQKHLPARPQEKGGKKVVESYDYHDESGCLLFQVQRLDPKGFRQRRQGDNGEWIYNMKGVSPVLFRLPEILAAVEARRTIYLVEGEKDVMAIVAAGQEATCNPMGAGKWQDSYTETLRDASVVVVVDRDEAGQKHAALVEARLKSVAASLSFVQAKTGKDAADHLAAGHAIDEFQPYHETPSNPSSLKTIGELYDMESDEPEWLVDDLFSVGSFNCLIAKPKVGKSTFVRELVRAIATGQLFLGRSTKQGQVIYFALEENLMHLKSFFLTMGLERNLPILISVSTLELASPAHLEAAIRKHGTKLVIIDTLIRAIPVRDLNDYAQVSQKLAPWVDLCRLLGVTLLVTHHARKGFGDDAGESALGSTAIFGSVDTLVRLNKSTDGVRLIETEQRYGVPLESTELEFDAGLHRTSLGRSRREKSDEDVDDRILRCLEGKKLTQKELNERVSGQITMARVKALVRQGKIREEGKGKRGDPFIYSLSSESNLDDQSLLMAIEDGPAPEEGPEEFF